MVTLIVFASLRVGEVLGLRWNRVKVDRLVIVERVYDDAFDDVKTDAGHREVPFDQRGVIADVLRRITADSRCCTASAPEQEPRSKQCMSESRIRGLWKTWQLRQVCLAQPLH